MDLKLFVEDLKGYMDTYTNVKLVFVRKLGKKNILEVRFTNNREPELIPLAEVRLAFMIDLNTMDEMFRYEK